jgi:transposase-like protein
MNPRELFCLNPACPAKGQRGEGNIQVHSQREQRCICTVCKSTFSASKGTIFYRLQSDGQVVVLVLTLLAYGCPLQAAALAFNLDERTVKSWWQRAGAHCESFHHHMVSSKPLDLQQVQARPEGTRVKAKLQGGACWIAIALMVPTRLWLGGVVAIHRDATLIGQLVAQIVGMARCRPLLLAVDGFAAYVGAFQAGFRSKLPRFGQPGRAKLVAWPDIAIVQVIKRRLEDGLSIERRIVQGAAEMVERLRQSTQGTLGVINTAYIERFNATCANACTAPRGLPPGALGRWLNRPLPSKLACTSSAVSTTSVTFIRVYGFVCWSANRAPAGFSAPLPWLLVLLIIAGHRLNSSRFAFRPHLGILPSNPGGVRRRLTN